MTGNEKAILAVGVGGAALVGGLYAYGRYLSPAAQAGATAGAAAGNAAGAAIGPEDVNPFTSVFGSTPTATYVLAGAALALGAVLVLAVKL